MSSLSSSLSSAAAKMSAAFSVVAAKIAGLPPKAVVALIGIVAVGAVASIAALSGVGGGYNTPRPMTIAFIGNRFLAMNDLPRLMIAMSEAVWNQKSCLHSRGSLVTVVETGNGMYRMWKGQTNAFDDEAMVYEYGACTLEHLFKGSDNSISFQNANGAYYDDGRNPCFNDQDYYTYTTVHAENQTLFDFVILSDHAKRVALSRDQAIAELEDTYATYLQDNSGAVPIIVSPNAYWSQNSNMTGLDDVASFTSLIYEGSLEYANALSNKLTVKARVAPVSLGFLIVFEEDPDLWSMLFDSYDVHASVIGSYLIGCILYSTMTGKMPPTSQQADVEELFGNARLLTGDDWGYPDSEQAAYLWNVARRVTIQGYKPKTLEM